MSRTHSTRNLACCVAAALAVAGHILPSPASAKTINALNVVSPSKKIRCWAVRVAEGGPAIECQAPYLPRRGELDPYFQLKAHGRTDYGQRGDFDGYPHGRRAVLGYGDEWAHAGATCAMARSGLTCRNLDGHGFHLQKGHVSRF